MLPSPQVFSLVRVPIIPPEVSSSWLFTILEFTLILLTIWILNDCFSLHFALDEITFIDDSVVIGDEFTDSVVFPILESAFVYVSIFVPDDSLD